MAKRPGGPLARRPLHFIWIVDCSGSMGHGGKIQSLNNAIREALPLMQDAAAENPNAEVIGTRREVLQWGQLARGQPRAGRAVPLG